MVTQLQANLARTVESGFVVSRPLRMSLPTTDRFACGEQVRWTLIVHGGLYSLGHANRQCSGLSTANPSLAVVANDPHQTVTSRKNQMPPANANQNNSPLRQVQTLYI